MPSSWARVPGLVTIALVAAVSGCGGVDPDADLRAGLRALPSRPSLIVLDMARMLSGGTGVSAAVVVEGESLWAGASGRSGPETPLHPDMLFDVGSVGKNLVAALVLQLAEEERLHLEDPVGRWLPPYPHVDPEITIRQLLGHTSGVFDFVEHPRSPFRVPFDTIAFDEASSPEATLRELASEPYFPPGEGWRYSTTNYLLLRLIVEQATGSTVRVAIQERFLDPLALERTVVLDEEHLTLEGHEAARPWFDVDGDGSPDDISSRGRAWMAGRSPAMVFASAADLARWAQALYDGRVLSPISRAEMLRFRRPAPGEPYSGFGLGTGELRFGGREIWGHLGWQYGYTAAMLHLPARRTSIALLINDNNLTCIGVAFVGLWGVVEYQASRAAFIVAGVVAILALSPLVTWPGGLLLRRRGRRRGEAWKRDGAGRGAWLLALAFAGVFLGVSVLYLLHSVNPEGPMAWEGGTTSARAALVLAGTGAGLAVVLLASTLVAWRRGRLPLSMRIHLGLVTLAAWAIVVHWQRLGLLLS
jgi:D-alanyl-D-alanine carboxypeptidase